MIPGGAVLTRPIAILTDGGFLLRRLESLGRSPHHGDPEQIDGLQSGLPNPDAAARHPRDPDQDED